MKRSLPLVLLFAAQLAIAQEFVEVPPPLPVTGTTEGAVAFADIDGDGDEDLLTTGVIKGTSLYLNDGTGVFTEDQDNPFVDVIWGAVAFSDVDGDGDEDALITGQDHNGSSYNSKLYINDGTGHFDEDMNAGFQGVVLSSVTFEDIDNDGDVDLLITGKNSDNERVALTYANDGSGSFTEVSNPFGEVLFHLVAFMDVDDDGDKDAMVAGRNSSSDWVAKLYANDGTGQFVEVVDQPFTDMEVSSFAFADLDSDGDTDALISGVNQAGGQEVRLYWNDGVGGFQALPDAVFENIKFAGKILFFDADGDGYEDVYLRGGDDMDEVIVTLFINDGSGSFSAVTDAPFKVLGGSSVAASDMDGDGDVDLFITGNDDSVVDFKPVAQFFINDGEGQYTQREPLLFEGAFESTETFAEVDGNDDQDVLLTGISGNGAVTSLYYNDGQGVFTKAQNTPFTGAYESTVRFFDVDSDDDLDMLISGGFVGGQEDTKLYINDGSGQFSEDLEVSFIHGVFDIADVDGDGDTDILIVGSIAATTLYFNDGDGVFSAVAVPNIPSISSCALAFSDVDNDGDEDVFVTGYDEQYEKIAKLYRNDGGGVFEEASDTAFDGVSNGSVAFADVNGDGYQDLFVTGNGEPTIWVQMLYLNDGTGGFEGDTIGFDFYPREGGSVDFSDVDSDGDMDLLMTGVSVNTDLPNVNLYVNDGNGVFSVFQDVPFEEVYIGSDGVFADIDGDGDEDILITGLNTLGVPSARLYLNESPTVIIDPQPDAPPFDFTLFPNPAHNGQVQISYESDINTKLNLTIYDLHGRTLRQQEVCFCLSADSLELDLSNLPQGTYFVQLQDGERVGVRKLVLLER